jgi:hypothetical protein
MPTTATVKKLRIVHQNLPNNINAKQIMREAKGKSMNNYLVFDIIPFCYSPKDLQKKPPQRTAQQRIALFFWVCFSRI